MDSITTTTRKIKIDITVEGTAIHNTYEYVGELHMVPDSGNLALFSSKEDADLFRWALEHKADMAFLNNKDLDVWRAWFDQAFGKQEQKSDSPSYVEREKL